SEALTNTARHARATAVRVEVAAGQTMLAVSVRDDGRGGADVGRGSGLTGLQDRVEALGGRITLHSPPGAGTALAVTIPLRQGPIDGSYRLVLLTVRDARNPQAHFHVHPPSA